MATAAKLPGAVRDRLESVQERLDILSRQVKGCKATHSTGLPSVSEFHEKLVSTSQLVSRECTKMAILFSNPTPLLDDCWCVCRQLEQAIFQLVNTLYQVNSVTQGQSLWTEATTNVLNILRGTSKLVGIFIKEGPSCRHAQLQGTGSVWSSCDAMGALSRDNKIAATKQLISFLLLLQDANKEAEELKTRQGEADEDDLDIFGEEEGDQEDTICSLVGKVRLDKEAEDEERRWSEEDMKTVTPCLRLVQVVVVCVKEVCAEVVCGGVPGVGDLDSIVLRTKLLSSLTDELVSELPAPISRSGLSSLVIQLGSALLQIIDLVDSDLHDNTSHRNSSKQYRDEIVHTVSLFTC